KTAELASPDALYKFEGQPYRLRRLDLSGLQAGRGDMGMAGAPLSHPRAGRGDMGMAGTLRYITGSGGEPGLHVAVQQAACALGFDSYTYGCLVQRVEGTPLLFVSSP